MIKNKNLKRVFTPQFQNLVTDCVDKYVKILGVSEYDVDFLYVGEDDKKPGREYDSYILASTSVTRRYLTATIKIYPHLVTRWKKRGREAVEECMAHECSHIATQHVFDLVTSCYKDEGEVLDAWESLTERMGRIAARLGDKSSKKLSTV